MANAWIVTSTPQVSALIEAGRRVGGIVTAVTVGKVGLAGVDSIVAIDNPPSVPTEAFAPSVAAAVLAGDGDIVLVPNRPAERVLAGAIAARLGVPVLTAVRSFSDGAFDVVRHGGIATELVRVPGAVVVVMDGGEVTDGNARVPVPVATTDAYAVSVSDEVVQQVEHVDLGSAKRVVCVGRGFRSEPDLRLARDLAAALNAELACSRPLAEGADWMPKESYIGVSGAHVKPELYVALGVSGQLQHMSGCQDAGTIVAVNIDEGAPIFTHSDFGIVGDLYQVVPALTAALG